MHTEIESAVNFLINTLSKILTCVSEENFITLKKRLNELLLERFDNHWYPEKPMKGSAYRCINISIDDGSVDAVLLQAGEEVGITRQNLMTAFPKGLALWVDPNDVSCRIGKGAIFPISRKIADPKPQSNVQGNVQRRPQQRPRSISPPTFQTSQYQSLAQQRPRSTTPPGFSSLNAGQMYQTIEKKNYSLDNLHKLWDTIPNTSSYGVTMTQKYQAPSYSSAKSYGQKDQVYSFNQYSSYYSPGSIWKKNNSTSKQYKPTWKDEETYNKYHWARSDRSSTSTTNSTTFHNYSNLSYGYSQPRYAQEVC